MKKRTPLVAKTDQVANPTVDGYVALGTDAAARSAKDFDDHDECRLRAASQIQLHEIQSVSADEVQRLKALAGHGLDPDIWSTPSNWLVHGQRIDAMKAVDLRSAALSGLTDNELATLDSSPIAEAAAIFAQRPTPASIVNASVLQAVRYLLLLRLGPSAKTRNKNGTASLKATSVATTAAGAIRRMVRIVIEKRLGLLQQGLLSANDTRYFALIHSSDLEKLPATFARNCKAEIRRMNQFFARQLWGDAPSPERDPTTTVDPTKPPLDAEPEGLSVPHLPLPDDYVALMGKRSLWIIHQLGPVLLDVGARMLHDWKEAAGQGHCSKDTRKQIALKVLADSFQKPEWDLETTASSSVEPPFRIQLSTHGKAAGERFKLNSGSKNLLAVEDLDEEPEQEVVAEPIQVDDQGQLDSWPPHNLAHFTGLCGVLQGAHFFVTSMALAARQSETMDLRRNCVVYGKDGNWRAIGRTFKLVQQFEGESRDWELPEVVARALEQQGRLVRLLEQMPWSEDLAALLNPEFNSCEGDHLWCRLGTGETDPRQVPRDPNKLLRKYARDLGMETAPGGQPLRTHRFRKTIARLAALAIDEAPLMLKSLFGHKDIEMTLHYILADKGLAAEIEQVVKELHMMRAKTPVEAFVAQMAKDQNTSAEVGDTDIDYAGYGGKAVGRIADTISRYRDQEVGSGRMRNSLDAFGAERIDDVVRILTGDGTYFEIVRPGVVCTKRLGELGPCSRNRGQPDRSNCQEDCDHRLEEPWQRADADGCVADALAGYQRAVADCEVLLTSFWGEQVRRNVVRFDDLRDKWMRNPTVAAIIQSGAARQAA